MEAAHARQACRYSESPESYHPAARPGLAPNPLGVDSSDRWGHLFLSLSRQRFARKSTRVRRAFSDASRRQTLYIHRGDGRSLSASFGGRTACSPLCARRRLVWGHCRLANGPSTRQQRPHTPFAGFDRQPGLWPSATPYARCCHLGLSCQIQSGKTSDFNGTPAGSRQLTSTASLTSRSSERSGMDRTTVSCFSICFHPHLAGPRCAHASVQTASLCRSCRVLFPY